jgi:hypothetical protein
MPFHSIVAEPQELAKLSAAFDVAWIDINSATPIAPAEQSIARERLGYIIVGLWKQGEEHLAAKGAQLFLDQATSRPATALDKGPA